MSNAQKVQGFWNAYLTTLPENHLHGFSLYSKPCLHLTSSKKF